MPLTAHHGAAVHDGEALHHGAALLVEDGLCAGIVPEDAIPERAERIAHPVGTICPGFVDLQVNGGGGVMLGAAADAAGLRRIAAAHAALGTAAFLPTLITDMPARTRAVARAVRGALAAGAPGIAGLHLEGPHLALARAGAHDPALIRPMGEADLAFLCELARTLPALMVTLAPEAVPPERIAALAGAGAVVSLGHTDAPYADCVAAARAGARCVTHLFNAMSQLAPRAPGLVGAFLDRPELSAGIIADGVHVHPAAVRAAAAARPGGLFLVTDAMAVAGTDLPSFALGGRAVTRAEGRLTLADGTLAGADLDMAGAVRTMAGPGGQGLAEAVAMATGRPAAFLPGLPRAGRLEEGDPFRALRLDAGGRLAERLGAWDG